MDLSQCSPWSNWNRGEYRAIGLRHIGDPFLIVVVVEHIVQPGICTLILEVFFQCVRHGLSRKGLVRLQELRVDWKLWLFFTGFLLCRSYCFVLRGAWMLGCLGHCGLIKRLALCQRLCSQNPVSQGSRSWCLLLDRDMDVLGGFIRVLTPSSDFVALSRERAARLDMLLVSVEDDSGVRPHFCSFALLGTCQ